MGKRANAPPYRTKGSITTNLRTLGLERLWNLRNINSADDRYLRGSVDEVCVFSRVLNAAEIAGLVGRGP